MRPYKSGYLIQGQHKIYYHCYGNPKGVPFLMIHGGPGYHSNLSNLKNFDLEKDFVILYDQRGCGKSKPFCRLQQNTTNHLVKDISALLDFFELEKANLVGGSWGSTLALVYGINHPERVSSITARGIFLGRKKDVDAIYNPKPSWSEDQLVKHRATLGRLQSKYKIKSWSKDVFSLLRKNNNQSIEVAKLWVLYEDLLCTEEFYIPLKYTRSDINTISAISLIECHYFMNSCFLENNFILNNSSKLKQIPITLLHGQQDMVCPIYQARELKSKIPNAKLIVDPNGGHSLSTGKMESLFKKAINETRKRKK